MHDFERVLGRLRGGADASSLETSTLEFKQEDASPRRTLESVADAVVCLANSKGGQVVLVWPTVLGMPVQFLG
jgi:ATP-dependent DNA helicase RecG